MKFNFKETHLVTLQQQLSPGHEPSKSVLLGLLCFCIFEKSGINEATDHQVSQLRGFTIAIISAHVPGPHIVGECWPGPEFKFSKTVEVGWKC